jgi:hypothetical protein
MWYDGIVKTFDVVNSNLGVIIDGIGKVIGFIGSIGALLISLITLFPSSLNAITITGIVLFGVIIAYKAIRKG